MRKINHVLNDLLAYQAHFQDLHHLGSSSVCFSLAQDILWWCLVLFQVVPLSNFMYFTS